MLTVKLQNNPEKQQLSGNGRSLIIEWLNCRQELRHMWFGAFLKFLFYSICWSFILKIVDLLQIKI